MESKRYSIQDLLDIMTKLRAPNGCPWDRDQDHKSLKRYLIEEAYEVLDAIDSNSPEKTCDELGDLLLQVVFHAQIAKENGQFDFSDVSHGVSAKMVNRHRHIFGDEQAETPDDVMTIWEKVKKEEKGLKTQTQVLKEIPRSFPALMRSFKVQQKAAQVGFDWADIKGAMSKVKEELEELESAFESSSKEDIEEELGDLLFAVVNVSRFLYVQPELALSATTNKFIRRFEYVEQSAAKEGKNLQDMSLDEMDEFWNKAKLLERRDKEKN